MNTTQQILLINVLYKIPNEQSLFAKIKIKHTKNIVATVGKIALS